jgi:flavorubredoxin
VNNVKKVIPYFHFRKHLLLGLKVERKVVEEAVVPVEEVVVAVPMLAQEVVLAVAAAVEESEQLVAQVVPGGVLGVVDWPTGLV